MEDDEEQNHRFANKNLNEEDQVWQWLKDWNYVKILIKIDARLIKWLTKA